VVFVFGVFELKASLLSFFFLFFPPPPYVSLFYVIFFFFFPVTLVLIELSLPFSFFL